MTTLGQPVHVQQTTGVQHPVPAQQVVVQTTVPNPVYLQNAQAKDHAKDPVRVEYHEENDLFYTKERLSYIGWIKKLGVIAILASIAALVLSIIHSIGHPSTFPISLVVTAAAFLVGSVISVVWALRSTRAYEARTEIFQPARSNDNSTKAVFVLGLILAGVAAVVLVNLYVQAEYTPDYVRAQPFNSDDWRFTKRDGEVEYSVNRFFTTDFVVQSCIAGFLFFFFLLASRAAFRCLKYDNQAMSWLVFLGNVFLLAFGLAVTFYSEYAFGYGEYPFIRAQFPVWNIRGLHFLGIAVSVISIVGFFVDHRSWRVGFFVLAFLLLLVLVFLVNFTGFAYRHTRHVYEFYKGTVPRSSQATCLNRMYYTHMGELQNYGCQKYVDSGCLPEERRERWEPNTAQVTPVQATSTVFLTEEEPLLDEKFWWDLTYAEETTGLGVFCLNKNCCGLQGQIYSDHLLVLANLGLLATLAGALVSVGCYYFWYVTWVDSNRNKQRDFVWLGLMALVTIAFIIVYFVVPKPYILEKLRPDGTHY